jgi:chromosome segregation ATPase
LRGKLNAAHKDFKRMNDKILALEQQALAGTEAAQHRNDILLSNLERVSYQFEVNTRDSMNADKRVRQLEFEMQELVDQFNRTGKDRDFLEKQTIMLSEQLETQTRLNEELTTQNSLLTMQNTQMDEELKELTKMKDDLKYDFEKKIKGLTLDLDKTTKERDELDRTGKKLSAENEKMKNALKELSKAKDKLETNSRAAEQKFKKELHKKDEHVKKLYEELAIERKNIDVLEQGRESLMFQVTQLKNNLDEEQNKLGAKVIECENLEKRIAEIEQLSEEKVMKLQQIKANLTKDKSQLTNAIREVRHLLSESQRGYAELESKFHKYTMESTKKIEEQAVTIAQLEESYKQSSDAHAKLKTRFKELQSSFAHLKSEHHSLQKTHDKTSMKLKSVEQALEEANGVRHLLLHENTCLKAELTDTKERLQSVVEKLEETESSKFLIVTDLQEKLSDREHDVRTLTKHIFELSDYKKRILLKCRQLILQNEQLQDGLNTANKNLFAETMSKASLELTVNELRQTLTTEVKTRMEYERLYSRLHRKVSDRDHEKLRMLQSRERKMRLLDSLLKQEYHRVSDVVYILEHVDLPEVSKFNSAMK